MPLKSAPKKSWWALIKTTDRPTVSRKEFITQFSRLRFLSWEKTSTSEATPIMAPTIMAATMVISGPKTAMIESGFAVM